MSNFNKVKTFMETFGQEVKLSHLLALIRSIVLDMI
jgi:hypothetical protein